MAKLQEYLAHQLKEMHTKNKIDFMQEADEIITKMLNPDWEPPVVKAKKNSTKCASYQQFLIEYPGDIHRAIYNCILNSPDPLSRQEIANSLGLRLSTVCGRVAEILDSEAIIRNGKKIDSSTKRLVETLATNIRK